MARPVPKYSFIRGISYYGSESPYKNLNEVLNKIGVMAKRNEVPYLGVIIKPSKIKPHAYYETIGSEYYVPKNWRDCLYEDLETGRYYVVSPDPRNAQCNPDYEFSWIAFQVTDLCDGKTSTYFENTKDFNTGKKEILHHTGSFIELIRRVGINEAFDTLAARNKPIIIKHIEFISKRVYDERGCSNKRFGSVCQLDID